MQEGWIKLSRKLPDNWLWQDAERLKWWLDLLYMAAWEDVDAFHDSRRFTLRRGQMVASISFLARRWGKSEHTIIRFLKELEQDGMISRQVVHRQTPILTICNYASYQVYNAGVNAGANAGANAGNIRNKEIKNNIPSSSFQSEDGTSTSPKGELDPASEQGGKEEVDYKKFFDFFNAEIDQHGSVIRKVVKITERRKGNINARCREFGKHALFDMVKKAVVSDFLNGKNKKGWAADFDWLMRPNNFPKVVEGNYDNDRVNEQDENDRQLNQATAKQKRDAEFAEYIARKLGGNKVH